MNRSLQLLTCLWALGSTCLGNDFDHWYFSALSKGGSTSVRYLDKVGTEMKVTAGTRSGKISKDGKTFIESREEIRKSNGKKETHLIRWTQTSPQTYQGLRTNSQKHTSKITLKIKNKTLLKLRYTTSHKITFHVLARLQDDGRIYFQSSGSYQNAPAHGFSIVSWFIPNKK